MTSPATVERNTWQVDNDVQAIYESLVRVDATQQRQESRFDEIDSKLDKILDRLRRRLGV